MGTKKLGCGTYAMYQRHYKNGERCEKCWSFAQEYNRQKYIKAKVKDPERLRLQSLKASRRRRDKDPEKEKIRARNSGLKATELL